MADVTRRDLCAMGAALGAASAFGLAGTAQAQPASAPFLTSDIGTLRKVLVHSITDGEQPIGKLDEGLLPYAEADEKAAAEQQAALMTLLRDAGAELIEISDALDAAIEVTRPSGVFAAWVDAAFPRLAADPAKVTGAMLLGRDPSTHYRLGPDGSYRHSANDSTSTMWTRDSAFMTPQGLVMCNAASPRRHRENMLLRYLYQHSPLLEDYPIIFDAVEEGMIIEGGDAMVVDERTLFLGVGNRTDPRIAPVLARRLNMDILTVQTVDVTHMRQRGWSDSGPAPELRVLLLHLDTYFTHVAPKHGLVLPLVMEKDHAEDNPLARFIRGARAETKMSEKEAESALKILKEFGKVTLYRRGSGKADDLDGLKLVDYLRKERYRLTYTGGPLPEGDQDVFHHFMTVAYPEQRRQATNVVQAVPGRVIAYSGNPYTKQALEEDGIAVDTFHARELWAWHGGPHCLTQPLERA